MWTETGHPGGVKTMGRKEVDDTGITETNLSKDVFHITIDPPVVFDFIIEISWSYLSSLLSSQEYSPRKRDMQLLRSEVKIFGSLMKIKSGLVLSVIFLRL